MKERTKLGLYVLEAAALLGVLGDALLRATPWGVNVFLWAAALVAAVLALSRRRSAGFTAEGGWLLPSLLFFAAAFAWRDSLTLKTLDVLAVLGLASLASLAWRGGWVRLAGVAEYSFSLVVAGFHAAFGSFPLLFGDIGWKEIPRTGWTKHALSVARGLLIAVPLLLLFGALFMAADAVFEGIVENTFHLEADVLVSHVFLVLFFAWTTGGFLRGMLLGRKKTPDALARTTLTTPGLPDFSRSVNIESITNPPASVTADAGTERAGDIAADALRGSETDAAREERKGEGKTGEGESARSGGESEASRASRQNHAARRQSESARRESERAWQEGRGGATQAQDGADASQGGATQPADGATPVQPSRVVSLGIVEIGIVLGLVNLLFFSFVAVQVRYFFGGAEWVVTSTGLTYSEYARRGFFELVWVALLVLPLLLAAHWLLRKENPSHERIFRGLAGALVVLLFVIMLSAVKRMRLYQSEYGLTELRLYTTAFMGWLGLVFVWFSATVLRGRRERFACGALVAGLCVVGMLHVVNPDDLIVRTNASLVKTGRDFDATYAASLSADAVPALVRALPEVSAGERRAVASNVLNLWAENERPDWRTWNWSRSEARAAVREQEATLREWANERIAEEQSAPVVEAQVTEGR